MSGSPPEIKGLTPTQVWMDEQMDHMKDALLYGSSMIEIDSLTATQVMMEEKEARYRAAYGGRGHGKTITGRWQQQQLSATTKNYQQKLMAAIQNSGHRPDLRRDGTVEPSIDPFLYPNKVVKKMEEAPTNTISDRHYLCLTVTEYQDFAECIQKGCYLNKEGSHCKVKNAKTKKLKNLVYKFKKSPYLHKSLIWKAQMHVIKAELERRKQWATGN